MAFSQQHPSTGSRMSSGALSYLYHHIFLPPKLPQKDDIRPEYEVLLLDLVVEVLLILKARLKQNGNDGDPLRPMISMIIDLRILVDSTGHRLSMNEERLLSALNSLCAKGQYMLWKP